MLAVTSTLMVQVLSIATVPPEKVTLAAPAVAVNVPLHVLVAFGVAATVIPAGNGSLNSTSNASVPCWGSPTIVKVRVAVSFTAMVLGENSLLS